MRPQHPLPRFFLAALVLATTLTFSSGGSALADQVSDAQSQVSKVTAQAGQAQARADKVEAEVNSLQNKAEQAAENYDQARSDYDQVSAQVVVSKRKVAKLTRQKNALQSTLDERATTLYREGPLNFLNTLLGARTITDFEAAYQILTNLNYRDADNIAQLKLAKADAATAESKLLAQQADAAAQKRAMAANQVAVNREYAAARQVLAQADASVKALIAQKQAAEAAEAQALAARALAEARARRAAAAAAAAVTHTTGSGSFSGGVSRAVHVSASGDTGERAVQYALSRLGCPYVWAAAGPRTFDCSGLTMWAYRQAGVSLPHYSRAQYTSGRHVSRSDLQPGDLVFFGSPIHHVGMYIGGGNFVEAPYSGADVRVSRLSSRGDFAGACRPW